MKGVSTVIAVLLMLIIAIALVALAWGFISGTFSSSTVEAFSVGESFEDTVRVTNEGTETIESFSPFIVDGNPSPYTIQTATGTIEQEETGFFKIETPLATGSHTLRLCTLSMCQAVFLTKIAPPP